jgi:hypothetical protein
MVPLRIAFLGQCHTVGYAGVPADSTFPEVCRSTVQASRPQYRVEIDPQPYYHPAELPDVVRTVLRHKPKVVVLEVVGWLTVAGETPLDLSRLPRGIRNTWQRVRFMRRATRFVAERTRGSELVHQVRTSTLELASSVLRPLMREMPRATLAEYETCVANALTAIRASGVTPVVQGPGAASFSVDSQHIPPDILERYRGVEAMARRVATAHSAIYVDRWDTVAGNFFLPGSPRPSMRGHSVWGHLLADHLLREGVV